MIIKELEFLNHGKKYLSKNAFLFYGPNLGKSEEIYNEFTDLIQKNDSSFGSIVKCNDDVMSQNKDFFSHNMASDDIFGGKKIIYCNIVSTKNFITHIKSIPDKAFNSCKLLIRCGELEKKNSIRKAFEEDINFVSVACFEDTLDIKKKIIIDYLKKNNEQINSTHVDIIAENAGKDRQLIYQNLKKIVSYLKSGNKLDTRKLMNIINETNKYEINQLTYSVFSGKILEIEKIYALLLKQGSNNLSITNAFVRHLYKILELKEYYSQCNNYSLALKKLFPPVFFKYEKEFLLHSRIWGIEKIESLLINFFEIEKVIKSNAKYVDTIIKFKLIQMCAYAKRKKDSF